MNNERKLIKITLFVVTFILGFASALAFVWSTQKVKSVADPHEEARICYRILANKELQLESQLREYLKARFYYALLEEGAIRRVDPSNRSDVDYGPVDDEELGINVFKGPESTVDIYKSAMSEVEAYLASP